MTGGSLSLGLRTVSYGSLQQQQIQASYNSNGNGSIGGSGNNNFGPAKSVFLARKSSSLKMLINNSREKEKVLPFFCYRVLGRRRVSVLLLFLLALLVFTLGSLLVNKESSSPNLQPDMKVHTPFAIHRPYNQSLFNFSGAKDQSQGNKSPLEGSDGNSIDLPPPSSKKLAVDLSNHPCKNFAFPPPPPPGDRRIGPRPCPVCYIPPEQAMASMPGLSLESMVLHNLTYVYDKNPTRTEPHGGSEFGGYPTLKQRNDSYDIKESMTVHCGFVKGSKPGHHTGFDIDDADLSELEQPHDIVVASAIFGNYDIIQLPVNISEAAKKNVPFYMFIDEETEAYMKKSSLLNDTKKIGLWRIIVVHNVPYSDPRRNGKIPKLLLHRIFPNIRYSIWIDGKLKLVMDPYQVLERFLWRTNANFAISRHYRRFSVFDEAEANKAAGKYSNSSIDAQIDFYKMEGLTPYSEAKLPITSDVPEGCVIIKEHSPISNLFTCLWFNEVDRFTSRDQLSFSTVRDKVMAKADWSINMFLDCERRNFVIQAYHKDLLDHMPPPPVIIRKSSSAIPVVDKNPGKRNTPRHREKRSSSRRHRKVVAGNKENASLKMFVAKRM